MIEDVFARDTKRFLPIYLGLPDQVGSPRRMVMFMLETGFKSRFASLDNRFHMYSAAGY